jgi:hypothetical protein
MCQHVDDPYVVWAASGLDAFLVWLQQSFFFLSLLLEFNASPFKISNQPLNFFLFHICSLSFWLFFLIIYKITNIFQFHPLLFFYFLKFDPHFFIAIYFVWNHFLDCFFTISSSIVFFLSDLILILLLLSFLLWQVF